jgi:tetratricopeptide (TPR) repeat protein
VKIQGKKIVFTVAGLFLAALLVAAAFFAFPAYKDYREEKMLYSLIRANKGAAVALKTIEETEKTKVKDPFNVGPYITIGNNWVLIADLLASQRSRDKAIVEYEKGERVSGQKNSVIIVNAGNAYRASGRLKEAEGKYRLAIQINPGDPTAYEKLVELYRFDLKKSPAEIIPIFQEALDKLVDNTSVVLALSEYLVSINRLESALQYYELLAKRYPDQFNPVVSDLKTRIAVSKTVK